jgi:integrase
MLDSLEPRGGQYTVWDDELPGFGVRVTRAGTISFVLDYITRSSIRHRQTIGRYGAITVDQARDEAMKILGQVAAGLDPLDIKRKAREGQTIREFAAEYLAHAKGYKKPASIRADTYALDAVIVKKQDSRRLDAVTREDVARLHRSLQARPHQANRILATFSHLYTVAAAWGRVPEGFNPCRHVAKFQETKRKRFLDTDELARLGETLVALEPDHPYEVRVVRLLLLTGCRLNEILSFAWADVDLEHAVRRLRDAKAGPRDVPLGAAAIDVLQPLARESEWVIPSRSRKGRHLVNLSTFWHRDVITAAELPGVPLA